ncbi:arylsulfatase B-like [Lineus longissimus]|uniref:arylsulfatase B-like n=1 Tax=Lineus longissimus TaxID=88925 RepID=UPI00315D84FD
MAKWVEVGGKKYEEDSTFHPDRVDPQTSWPEEGGHRNRLAMVNVHREIRQGWEKTMSIFHRRRYGNTVYLGTFIFVVIFVFTIGAAIRHGGPDVYNMRATHAIRKALSAHARRFLPFYRSGPMNVIFIVADDLGWNDIGYRNPEVVTQNLNRLAREGVVLNQSYVQSTCSPSRAAMMTGYYPHRMGLQHRTITVNQAKFIPLSIPTLAEELKSRGYTTRIVGKWHVGHCNWKYTPTNRGFDSHFGYLGASEDYYKHTARGVHDYWNNTAPDFDHENVYSTDTFADIAVDLIRDHAATRAEPLFMYLAFQSIHGPLNEPPGRYISPRHNENTKKNRRTVNNMILALDVAIGRVANALEETGMMGNTLLVFTSDNGGALDSWGDNTPLRGGKFTQWEGGTRAVTFINSPMVKSPGREFNGLFHAVDWAPTILAAVDSQLNSQQIATSDMDGLNQWDSLVENTRGITRNDMVYIFDEVDGTYAYRYGHFKLIIGPPVCAEYQHQMTENKGPDPNCWYDSIHTRKNTTCDYELADTMLFNVVNDPEERFNLAARRPDVVNALKQKMKELKKDAIPNQSNEPVDISGSTKDAVLYPGWC